ncbi:hypothetical protein B0T25DRAFT_545553 [Lasiosphaeria hispida]|uniref:Uncharacterized protein n=1 Tax=Lasiosphaeria hispida TaxID=260671 RepID=A0AAJ0HJU6_9PEZI|nr:hypothetical protein B0T25DRAFT_545553 [Lasiosphaeria hispida]
MSQELSPEEKYKRREKEILFLRHKIQKAVIPTGGGEIKAEDMKCVSSYLNNLERIGRVEAAILRTSKIHKLMKYIAQKVQPDRIPDEAEFQLIPRSRALWSLYLQVLAEDADGTGIAAALGKKLVINDDGAEAVGADTAIPAPQPVAPPAISPHSGDLWIWVGTHRDDTVYDPNRPMTRHPGWDDSSRAPPPECGSSPDVGEEMDISTYVV